MSITPHFLDQLKSRLLLSEIIGKRAKLQRAGREFKACCPFHQEKTPSFTVNDDKQFYHCFGCGAHGDAIGFVMQHDNLSFIEAVELLAAKAGMQVPKSSPEEVERGRRQKTLHAMMDITAKWYQKQLFTPANRRVYEYLKDRGLSRQIMESFRLGYAPPESDSLKSVLVKEGYEEDDLVACGVYRKSEKSIDLYPFMRDRVVFPVTDRRGRIVAFGGRTLPADICRSSYSTNYTPPKYLNSSETALFSKGRTLYGESQARQAVAQQSPLIVVEGYLDVIACHQAGLRGAVAPLGTALTEDQISSLWQMLSSQPEQSPILCFDGDSAGLKAAERACERALPLLTSQHSLRFAFLPDGQDPDSLIKLEGKESFVRRLDESLSLVDFIWMRAISGRMFETPEARAALEENLEQLVRKISSRTLQHYYRQVIREKIRDFFFRSKKNGQQRFTTGLPMERMRSQESQGSVQYVPGRAVPGGDGMTGRGSYAGGKVSARLASSAAKRGSFSYPGRVEEHTSGRSSFSYPSPYPAGRPPAISASARGLKLRSPSGDALWLREKIMLATLINHPVLIREVEDDLERCEISDSRLDKLRQSIFNYYLDKTGEGENVEEASLSLNREKVIASLKESGFGEELELILNENIYIHAGFARPQRDSAQALEGWREIWALIDRCKTEKELMQAGRRLADELTDESQDHFFHLIREKEKTPPY